MAYAIINEYIDRSLYPLKSPHEMKPEFITIHNTYNDATALNEIAYMKRNEAATSYHVAIDDKHVVQAIPFTRNAWHAGDGANGAGNRKSIGVEICYSKSGGEKYRQAEANAIEYVTQLLHKYGWGIDRVKWHRDWSGKNCPHRIFAEGRADEVKKRIADRLAVLNKKEDVKVAAEENQKASASLAEEFARAIEAGITDGSNPHRLAKREEVAVMVLRALEKVQDK